MKKKNKFFVNVALIALALCVMVYGVYAAKNASLTVKGTIGFTAHGIQYAVTSVGVNKALNAAGETYDVARDNAALAAITRDAARTYNTSGELVVSEYVADGTNTTFYFDDLTNSTDTADNIEAIEIVIEIQNRSMFKVQVDATEVGQKYFATDDNNVSYTVTVNYGTDGEGNALTAMAPASSTGGSDGGYCTVTIALTLEKNATTYQTYEEEQEGVGKTTEITDFAADYAPTEFNVPLNLHLETPAAADPSEPDAQG